MGTKRCKILHWFQIRRQNWKKRMSESYYQKTAFLINFWKNFFSALFLNFIFRFGISIKFCVFWYPYWPIWGKKVLVCMLRKIFCVKGSVQRKLRPMLLYIIWKVFSRRRTAGHLNFSLLKGHFTIYIKPFSGPCTAQLLLQANITAPHKSVSADSNRHRKRRPRTVIIRGHAFTGLLLSAANFKKNFCLCK